MPSRRAACACVLFQPRTWSLITIMTFDRIVIVAASSGLSSRASHTLAKVLVFLILLPLSCRIVPPQESNRAQASNLP